MTLNTVGGPSNSPPVAANDSYSTNEDAILAIPAPGVLANDSDPDGQPLTATLVSDVNPLEGHVTLNADGSFTFTPAANFNGVVSFAYRAVDSAGASSDVATVTITVTPVNDPPVAVGDTATTPEDAAVVIAAAANDTDVDGNPLAVKEAGLPGHGTATVIATGPDAGKISYVPASNYNGPDSFSYTVTDGTLTAIGTVSVSVTPVNDAPVAADDPGYGTNEDTVLTVVARGVLKNDTDVEGSGMTAVLVAGPPAAQGTVVLNGDGSFTFTPATNFNGAATFTYRATDGALSSNVATVTIAVSPVNDPPVAVGDTVTTPEDTAVVIAAAANDTDVDGNTLSVSAVGLAGHGSATVITTGPNAGRIWYVPVLNYNGPDSFSYTVSDGNGGTAVGTVSVTVTPVNDPPVAVGDTATTPEDAAVVIAAAANDTDVDGNPLTVKDAGLPGHGTATVIATGPDAGKISYVPASNYNGPDSFSYTVTDGTLTATGTVSVSVTPVNDAPVAADDPGYSTNEDTVLTVAAKGVLKNDTDVDGSGMAAVLVAGPSAAQGTVVLNGDGSFTFTPTTNFNGAATFTYRATDGALSSNVATVTIAVSPVNDGPVVTNPGPQTTLENVPVSLQVVATDADGDPRAFAATGLPAGLGISGSGLISGTVSFDAASSYNVTVTVTDGQTGSTPVSFTWNITNVNRAPVVTNPGPQTTLENAPVSLQVVATDADGNPLAFAATGLPAGLGISSSGLISGTVSFDAASSYNVTVTVTDGQTGSTPVSFTWSITNVNRPPVVTNPGPQTTLENAPVSLQVVATDADGNPRTFAATGLPAGLGISSSGLISGTVSFDAASSYNVTVTVTDGQTGSTPVSFTWSITNVNRPPVVTNPGPQTTLENAPVSLQVVATDADGNPRTFAATGLPAGLGISSSGLISGTVSFDAASSYNVTVTVTDGQTGSTPVSFTWSITNVNRPPVVTNPGPQTTLENAPVSLQVVATDADGNPRTFAATGLPAGLGISSSGLISGTVSFDAASSYNVTVTVTDGQTGSTPVSFTWSITNVNRPPVVTNPGPQTTLENAPVSLQVVATDADGNPRTFAATGLPAGLGISSSGLINGTVSFDAASSYNVTVTVTDGQTGSTPVSFTWSITNVNRAPAAQSEAYNTAAGTTLVIAAPGLLSNDADVDGDSLQALFVTAPPAAAGTLTLGANGSFTYVPASGFTGTATFTYSAGDGVAASAAVIVNIAVNGESVTQALPANGASQTVSTDPSGGVIGATPADPVETSVTTPAGMTGTITIAEATPTDEPPAGYKILGSQVNVTAPATATVASPLMMTFRLDASILGTQSLTSLQIMKNEVVVPDCATSPSTTASPDPCVSKRILVAGDAEITVLTTRASDWCFIVLNHAPVANGQSVTTPQGTAKPITLTSSDVDGDTLSYLIETGPASGQLTGAGAARTYTPNAGFSGSDSFTFTVNDGSEDSNVATVSITVTSANRAPVASAQSVTVGTARATSIVVAASDADNNPLTYSIVTGPSHGTLTGTAPNLTYTSTAGYTGSDSFTFKANDSAADSNVATVSITVVTQKATTTGLTLTSSPVQYSDRLSMEATLTPPAGDTATPAASVTFKIGQQILDTKPLTFSGGVWRAALSNYQVLETSPAGQLKPGSRIVTAVFNQVNQNFAVSNPVKTVLINREDAQIAYTGARGTRAVQTESPLSGRAAIVLSATVAEIAGDTNLGDIQNATLMFVNRENGATIATVPVAADGTATFTWNVDILLLPSKVYNIGMVVGNYYVRNTTADDVSIEVYKP